MNKENDKKQITIRIDSELHKKLKITAVAKDVSINDYVVSNYVDYSNNISDLGYNIGKSTEIIMNKGIKKTLKVLRKLFFD